MMPFHESRGLIARADAQISTIHAMSGYAPAEYRGFSSRSSHGGKLRRRCHGMNDARREPHTLQPMLRIAMFLKGKRAAAH